MSYQTIAVTFQNTICRVRLQRPEANNAINSLMIEDLSAVLALCESEQHTPAITIIVLEGLPDVFCAGGDLEAVSAAGVAAPAADPEPLYDLWLKLATSSLISICVVRGRVNAGGVGFVAAADIVLADSTANFSLSELLFGLFPACVMPFLVRRVGLQKAHYLTLMTSAIDAQQALAMGLVDVLDEALEVQLRKHLLRLQRLSRPAVARYKAYLNSMTDELARCKPAALAANRQMFNDPEIRHNIERYVTQSLFPWER